MRPFGSTQNSTKHPIESIPFRNTNFYSPTQRRSKLTISTPNAPGTFYSAHISSQSTNNTKTPQPLTPTPLASAARISRQPMATPSPQTQASKSAAPYPNIYHVRKVADTATKPCFICYKPTAVVLITPCQKVRLFLLSWNLIVLAEVNVKLGSN